MPEETPGDRVTVSGKFFRLSGETWYLKGLTYGPFAPDGTGLFLPGRDALRADLDLARSLGANCLRLYHLPPSWMLDDALARGLRIFVDVPWEKHRCFFEDWSAMRDAREAVRRAARELGSHPGLFALSVVNEIPSDVVRFYGRDRVARFVGELIDVAKQAEPACLATFANYPSTEFLNPPAGDFLCFNVYLEEEDALGGYLDRLQHVAGALPLILGEFGVDSLRHGEPRQAELLAAHVRRVSRQGLAGSFVFALTDDWFTGGHQIEDWAFGVTRCDRSAKPAAAAIRDAWSATLGDDEQMDREPPLSRVSVVVCSYNGAATLRECLRSLEVLDYPDYEVILIDDGSTDDTPAIAADFPKVRALRQGNLGLSAARNAGMHAASGDVVAYTDSDCMADPQWLRCLVRAMRDQRVEAIGGPNVPPPSDGWVAKCVAASPGGPSHVMLDDRLAEHVPGCNMAFARDRLLAIGGFDEQFRQAGDDVDICWRFLDAGFRIGYAPAALVWHHRRTSIHAYFRQQAGYGRSEAMVLLKHPARAGLCGDSAWNGIIYGDGAIGLATARETIYHGRFGTGSFQLIYRSNRYNLWVYATLLEWHALTLLLLFASVAWPPLGALCGLMASLSLAAATRSAALAPLPAGAPWWCRPLVAGLYLAQPVARAWHRHAYRLRCLARRPRWGGPRPAAGTKRVSFRAFDQYWSDAAGRGREDLLPMAECAARGIGLHGDFEAEWDAHDVELWPSPWHVARVRTATEELGWPRRFTRARTSLHMTPIARSSIVASIVCLMAGLAVGRWWSVVPAALPALVVGLTLAIDRRRCRSTVAGLLVDAAREAGLGSAPVEGEAVASVCAAVRVDAADERCVALASPAVIAEVGPWPPSDVPVRDPKRRHPAVPHDQAVRAGRAGPCVEGKFGGSSDSERELAVTTTPSRRAAHGRRPSYGKLGGFTLVELLVVIGIISVLIGILLPVLGRVREQSKRTACKSNLRSIGQSLYIYANAHRDRLPNGNMPGTFVDYDGANRVMVDFNARFIRAPKAFWCPSDREPPPEQIVTADQTLGDSARVSYDFYFLYWPPEFGPVLTRMKGRAPLAWDLDGAEVARSVLQNHGNVGGNVLFADGHVAWQDAPDWDDMNWPSPAKEFYRP